jgi:hypothetical protein
MWMSQTNTSGAIDRHPLTQRLNRELLDSFRRNSRLKEEYQSVNGHKSLETDQP